MTTVFFCFIYTDVDVCKKTVIFKFPLLKEDKKTHILFKEQTKTKIKNALLLWLSKKNKKTTKNHA